jgi:predicted ester cyclase
MISEDMVAFFARRLELAGRQDATALADLHTEDGVVQSPIAGGEARGREAIARVYQTFFDAFGFESVRQEELLVDGNRANWLLHLDIIDRGGLMGLRPTGRTYSVSIDFLCEFRDGLIARERRIYDFTGLLVQIGALKAKPI